MNAQDAEREPSASSAAYRQGAANLVALASVQLGNALLPLVAYPLVLSRVGAEPFSRIAVTESVMMIVLATVIYSFDIDGVARAAPDQVRADTLALSVVFSEVLVSRLVILAVATAGVLASLAVVDRATVGLLLMWLLFPLGYILQSAWFFQSLERNAVPATIVVVSRVACLGSIAWFVRAPDDYWRVPLIIGLWYAGGGAAILGFALHRHSLAVTVVSRTRIKDLLMQGKEIFVGNLSVALYRDSNVLILNALSSDAAVSLYVIAEKIVKVFQAGARPLNQLFFPKIIRALEGAREPSRAAFRTVLRFTAAQWGLLAGGIVVLAIFFPFLSRRFPAVFTSVSGVEVVQLVIVMGVSVFFGISNFTFGTGGLNYLNRRAYLAKCILATGVISVSVCAALSSRFGALGAAMTFAFSEILLFGLVSLAYLKGQGAPA